MQIITYLGFTLFSIFIQFSVIDFIQGRLKTEHNSADLKGTSPRRQFRDILRDITHKPHALYYQTQKSKLGKYHTSSRLLSNNSLIELLTATENPTTLIDILYEDNSTTTDETFTTEALYTSTEFENITEISFIEINNKTTSKPELVPKKLIPEECKCNLLYKVCDINCCCDIDCMDAELKLFPNCIQELSKKTNHGDCFSALPYSGYGNGLFCIVKTNLPDEKYSIPSKIDISPTSHFLTWKNVIRTHPLHEYTNKYYKYGDPIWILKNYSIYHIDLPTPLINNYCSGRKPMQFLKDEEYKCQVKIQDLEMLQISKSLEDSHIISATALSMNTSVLNCSNLYCTNWTIMACNETVCTNYKDIHEPTCTDAICVNLALRISYTFYYYDSKIVNASVQFYNQNITLDLPFLEQIIQVKFVLANESINRIRILSGSPGYVGGLPVIVSYAEKNLTDTFFNTTLQTKIYLAFPDNNNGLCVSTNHSKNIILFGENKRTKCRYNHEYSMKGHNSTDACITIQNDINKLLDHNINKFVSPLGNPEDLKDVDWIPMEKSLYNASLYGVIQDNVKFHCFNLVTKFSLVFSFANINGDNRILSCKYMTTAVNKTFDFDDLSSVVTADVSYVDVTRPSVIEYDLAPNLNLNIPKDFFYPFRSNESQAFRCNLFIVLFCVSMIIFACK